MLSSVSGIDLKFCSWSSPLNKELEILGINGFHKPVNKYDTTMTTDYIYNQLTDFNFSDQNEWPVPDDESCGHRPLSPDQKRLWSLGADGYHPGLHAHIHYAEHFLGSPIPQEFIETLPREFVIQDEKEFGSHFKNDD